MKKFLLSFLLLTSLGIAASEKFWKKHLVQDFTASITETKPLSYGEDHMQKLECATFCKDSDTCAAFGIDPAGSCQLVGNEPAGGAFIHGQNPLWIGKGVAPVCKDDSHCFKDGKSLCADGTCQECTSDNVTYCLAPMHSECTDNNRCKNPESAVLLIGGLTPGEKQVGSLGCPQNISDLPEGRGRLDAVYFDDVILYCGGIVNGVYRKTCYKLGRSGTWTSGPELKDTRGHHTLTIVGERLVLIAGAINSTPQKSTQILEKGGSWQFGFDIDVTRFDHCTVAVSENEVVVLGGKADVYRDSVVKFNIDTGVLTPLSPLTPARMRLACTIYAGKIYVAGGKSPDMFPWMETLDISSDSNLWETFTDSGILTLDAEMIVFAGRVTIFNSALEPMKYYTYHSPDANRSVITNGGMWRHATHPLGRENGDIVEVPCTFRP